MAGLAETLGNARPANVERSVDYTVGGKPCRGYAIWDDASAAPRPLVVSVPNFMGPTPANRDQARAIAGSGYVVFVADMYGRDALPPEPAAAMAQMKALQADRAELRRRILGAKAAALDFARSGAAPADGSKVGAIGFCFGGLIVLELARSGDDVAAVVSFHGVLTLDSPAENRPIRTRVLALHGDDDPHVPPAQVQAFETEMRAAKADWQLVRFGGAAHSFMDPNAKMAGSAMYDPKVARRAYAMMKDFLAEAFAR